LREVAVQQPLLRESLVNHEWPGFFPQFHLTFGVEDPLPRQRIAEDRDEDLREQETSLGWRVGSGPIAAAALPRPDRVNARPQLRHPHTERRAEELDGVRRGDCEPGWRRLYEEVVRFGRRAGSIGRVAHRGEHFFERRAGAAGDDRDGREPLNEAAKGVLLPLQRSARALLTRRAQPELQPEVVHQARGGEHVLLRPAGLTRNRNGINRT
jgi:hypothetical protein